MPDFDPAQPLPDDTVPIVTPVGTANQFGQAIVGAPSNPDPGAAQGIAQAQFNQAQAGQEWLATHDANTGAPKAPTPVTVAPVPAVDTTALPAVADNATPGTPAPVIAPSATSGGSIGTPSTPAVGGMAGSTPISQGAQAVIDKADRSELNTEAQGNLSNTTEFKQKQAQQDADTAKAAAALQAQQEKELQAAVDRGNKFVQDAQTHVDNASNDYQTALAEDKTHTIFTGKSTWQKAGAWLGLALGAIGAGFSAAGGHPTGNVAVTQLNKEVEDDFAKQRASIADRKDSVAMAQTGLRNAQDAKQALMFDLLAKQKATYATLEAQAKANAAGLGVQAATLDGSTLMTSLRQKQADIDREIGRQGQSDYLTRVKTLADVRKSNAEANNANAMATYHRAAAGAVGGTGPGSEGVPAPGSKIDKSIMTSYVNPARKDATKDKARVEMLSQLNTALNDPNLTYGQAKQILINGFTAAGNNPQGKIAVADIHEVLPGMQSAFGRFMSDLDQGANNRVSPEFRKTVSSAVKPEAERWTANYKRNGDTFEKNLGNLSPAAKAHYRSQIFPDVGEAPATPTAATYPVGTKAKNKAGQSVVMTATGWQPQ